MTYTAECTDTFDAQRVRFEEFAQDDDDQLAVTAAVALNLSAGENTIVITSLENRPTDLLRVSVAQAPQDIHATM